MIQLIRVTDGALDWASDENETRRAVFMCSTGHGGFETFAYLKIIPLKTFNTEELNKTFI